MRSAANRIGVALLLFGASTAHAIPTNHVYQAASAGLVGATVPSDLASISADVVGEIDPGLHAIVAPLSGRALPVAHKPLSTLVDDAALYDLVSVNTPSKRTSASRQHAPR